MIIIFLSGIFLGVLIHYRLTEKVNSQNKKLLNNLKILEKKEREINPKMLLNKKELKKTKNGKSKGI